MKNPMIILEDWLLAMDSRHADVISSTVLAYMPGAPMHNHKMERLDLVEWLHTSAFSTPVKAFGLCLCLEALITVIVKDYDNTETILANYQQQRTAALEPIDLLEHMEADLLRTLALRKEIKAGWQHLRDTYYHPEYLNKYWLQQLTGE
ncbi:hypothetical protein FC093_22675 [Ilyomonas limi]|uniref:Uncharacterized protein n=1 Tax=Ilyomonas limi TaxID=2575867 RepID=A0A4U3KQE8_9BACT|nr:hypothetical protein [Ilyomonas limi]TKK64361.1 hypothetical protein FC093_22675 [Ilyomonas limi]